MCIQTRMCKPVCSQINSLAFILAAVIVVHWSRVALSEADCPVDGYCAGYGILTAVPDDIPPLASQIHLQNNNISDIRIHKEYHVFHY